MAYNIIDIIDKIILISEKRKRIYENVYCDKEKFSSINVITKVLSRCMDREIEYYRKLKCEIEGKVLNEIDFVIYDKISFLINEFSDRLACDDVSDVNKLKKCSLEMDKKVLALLINVQGRFIKNEEDTETLAYETLTLIIKEKEKCITELEKYVN